MQRPETPLSPRGEAQAERLARRLAGEAVARVVASDLRRAAQTARAVAAATGAPLDLSPLLQERNFGDLRGTPYREIRGDPFAPGYHPPGGEGWEAFHARVDAAWRRVLAAATDADRSGGDVVVVTHGLVCWSLASRRLALPPGHEASWRIGNTALTVVEPAPPHAVRLLACTAHLEDPEEALLRRPPPA